MKSLKAQILALATSVQKVDIDGLDMPIYVKKLSLGETAALQEQGKEYSDKSVLSLAVDFAYFACNDKGEPIFSPDELDEIVKLPPDFVAEVVKQGVAFNYPNADKVDELEKNS